MSISGGLPPHDLDITKIKHPRRRLTYRARIRSKTKEEDILTDQDKERSHKERVAKWLIGLSLVGYGIMSFFLGLSGSNDIAFYLPPEVLMTLIVAIMGSSVVYALRNYFASIFS